MRNNKVTVCSGEEGFKNALLQIVHLSSVDCEAAMHFADEVWRERLELPADVIYSQIMQD